MTRTVAVAWAAALSCIGACGGGDQGRADTSATVGTTGSVGATASPGGSPAGAVTPAMVALGDSIFKGQAAGGICYTCHGPDAKGTPTGPDLTDSEWLNGDGSLPFIQSVVTNGVAAPKKHPAAMPPFGQMLTPEQVNAVSAYVYSLTRSTTD